MQKLCEPYENVEVLDIEAKAKEPQASYKTLQTLKLRYNFEQKPYFIIGADNVQDLPKWCCYEQLESEVVFIVAQRAGFTISKEYQTLTVNQTISSTELRAHFNKKMIPESIAESVSHYYKEHNGRTHR